jgi:sugar/nucleoside kinase (ribokinase family)
MAAAGVATVAADHAASERFLLCVGCEGLGDRLQTLTHAIRYARESGRTLVVDWRDPVWGDDFHRYFSIVGLPWRAALPPDALEEDSVWPRA